MSNDGGSAFPTKVITGTEYIENVGNRYTYDEYPGMTLRDYFAAKAMAAMIINEVDCTLEALAARSYHVADAMLKVRE
jgi:hypothetical protein